MRICQVQTRPTERDDEKRNEIEAKNEGISIEVGRKTTLIMMMMIIFDLLLASGPYLI